MIKIPPCKNCGHSNELHVYIEMKKQNGTREVIDNVCSLDSASMKPLCKCRMYQR